MDKEELIRRHELVTGSDYAAIRQRTVDYIIRNSGSVQNPEVLRGMMLTIKHIDSWEDEYKAELRKRKEQ